MTQTRLCNGPLLLENLNGLGFNRSSQAKVYIGNLVNMCSIVPHSERDSSFASFLGNLSFLLSRCRLALDQRARGGESGVNDHDFCKLSHTVYLLMRRLDVPPLWLLGCILLAWAQASHVSFRLGFGGAWAEFLGGLLIGGGILLTLLAVYEMRRHRTTLVPHKTPNHLVQTGIFSRSRNPIYLADILILAGFILLFDAVLSLPLIPVLTWILEKRFVVPEEDRMRRKFRVDWVRYEQKTRRWV